MAINTVGIPQKSPLNVNISIFVWPNFTHFALVKIILRKKSMTYERSINLDKVIFDNNFTLITG